jgi:hypothetical protein
MIGLFRTKLIEDYSNGRQKLEEMEQCELEEKKVSSECFMSDASDDLLRMQMLELMEEENKEEADGNKKVEERVQSAIQNELDDYCTFVSKIDFLKYFL